ncbi:SPATA2 [Branchiostoma lanceolatum]|uniref:SPATA2 protein n=1 Tax=Branchiostoma lanceolatum TaxID=7740 RepID=A0A8K0A7P6_BRALA|nr:SPATA2 [Branchiostoma lanceolatum]
MDGTNRKKEDLRRAVQKRYQHLIHEEATGGANNSAHQAKYGVTQRQDLLRLAKEYLACIEHNEKFILVPFNNLVVSALDYFDEGKVGFKKIAEVFRKLEQFGTNLILYPWRQEFKKIKTYTAVFWCQVNAVLPQSAEDVLPLLGYSKKNNVFVLQRVPPEEKLLTVAVDLFLCQAESLVMEDVYNEMSGRGFLPRQVVRARELMVGDRIECANFMKKQMRPDSTPQSSKAKGESLKITQDISSSSGRQHRDIEGGTREKSDRSSTSSRDIPQLKTVQSRTRGSTKSTSGYSSLGSRAQGSTTLSHLEKKDREKPGSWDESWTTKHDLGVDGAEDLFLVDEAQIRQSFDIRYPPADDIHGLPTTHDEHIMASMAEVFGPEDIESPGQTSKTMHVPDTTGNVPYRAELYKSDYNRYLLDVASLSKGHTAGSVPQPPPVHYPPHGIAVNPPDLSRHLGGNLLHDLQTDTVRGYEVMPMSNQLNRFPAEPMGLPDGETARLPRESSWQTKDMSSSRPYKGQEASIHHVPGKTAEDVVDGRGDQQNFRDGLGQPAGRRRGSLYDNVDSPEGATTALPGSEGKTSNGMVCT